MERRSVARDGIIAGVIGATVVALWFLIVDVLAGRPLFTPEVLGRGVLSLTGPVEDESATLLVALFTVIHYAGFIVLGIIAAAIVRASERTPALLAGALILFVAASVAFYGFTALLSESVLGALAWYQIGLANLLAAIAMGMYFWRRNPTLGRRLAHVLGGGEQTGRAPARD